MLIVSENGFTIHNIPADGDCMFNAILHQLNSIGLCDYDITVLSQKLADQIVSYCDFVCRACDVSASYCESSNRAK